MELDPQASPQTSSVSGGHRDGVSATETFGRGKRVAFSINVIVMVVIVLLIVGGINWLSTRPEVSERFDVTSMQVFTLGEKTRSVLSNLETDVEVYLYFQNDAAVQARPKVFELARNHARTILGEYKALSGGRVSLIDFGTLEPLRQNKVAQEIGGFDRANVVLFRSEGKIKVVDVVDVAITEELPGAPEGFGAPESRIVGWRSEDLFTSAILEVTEEQSKVYFLVGHQEDSIDGSDRGVTILQDWAGALRRDGYEAATLNLLESNEIPQDADAIVVALPKTDLADPEITLLSEALDQGIRLLWISSQLGKGEEKAPLPPAALFEPLGVSVEPRLVVQTPSRGLQMRFGPDAFTLLVPLDLPQHATTDPLIQSQMAVGAYRARPIDIAADAPADVRIQPVLRSQPNAWSKVFRPGMDLEFDQVKDRIEQFDLGVAIEKTSSGERDTRVVLFSGNIAISQLGSGNKNLFLNCINWLTQRTHLIGIDPKDYEERTIELDTEKVEFLFQLSVAYIPLAIIVIGLFVWWIRRS